MQAHHRFLLLSLTAAGVLHTPARAGGGPIGGEQPSIAIHHLFRGAPLELHERSLALRDTSATLEITRIEYIVSGVRLQKNDGAWTDFPEQYFHINPADDFDSISLAKVPGGNFKAIAFTVGLDEKTNHADPTQWPAGHALNPLENNLQWSWQGGYVFLAVEGNWERRDPDPRRETFLYHIGGEAARMEVLCEFPAPAPFQNVQLNFNVDRIWDAKNSVHPQEGRGLTHSAKGDDLAPRLARNVEQAFSVTIAVETKE